jgi:hypothetical protein
LPNGDVWTQALPIEGLIQWDRRVVEVRVIGARWVARWPNPSAGRRTAVTAVVRDDDAEITKVRGLQDLGVVDESASTNDSLVWQHRGDRCLNLKPNRKT